MSDIVRDVVLDQVDFVTPNPLEEILNSINSLFFLLLALFSHLLTMLQHVIDLKKSGSFGWLFGFYGISTFVGYLKPNPFYYK